MVITRFEKCISSVSNNIRRFPLWLPYVMVEGTVLTSRGTIGEGIAAPLHNLSRNSIRPVIRRFNDNVAAGGAEGALTEWGITPDVLPSLVSKTPKSSAFLCPKGGFWVSSSWKSAHHLNAQKELSPQKKIRENVERWMLLPGLRSLAWPFWLYLQ